MEDRDEEGSKVYNLGQKAQTQKKTKTSEKIQTNLFKPLELLRSATCEPVLGIALHKIDLRRP
jgi:hypothetical protein